MPESIQYVARFKCYQTENYYLNDIGVTLIGNNYEMFFLLKDITVLA